MTNTPIDDLIGLEAELKRQESDYFKSFEYVISFTINELQTIIKAITALRSQPVAAGYVISKADFEAIGKRNRELEGALKRCGETVQSLAFKMPPPNEWTPQFVEIGIAMVCAAHSSVKRPK